MQTKMSDSPLHKEGRIGRAIGTTLGGIGGFLIGGPAGAAVGASIGGSIGDAAGNKVDQMQKEKGTGPYAEEAAAQEKLLAKQQAIQENVQSMEEYSAEGDIASQAIALSSPATMKKLTAVGMSYSPMKMKYKEAKQAGLMMELSGASKLSERY